MAIRKQKESKMAKDDKPENAGFIGRVVGDPANPPQTRLLTGWLGDAGEPDYRRLYTDAELSGWVDIPDDAILYSEAIRDSQPAGGVLVWIKADAAIKTGGSGASRAGRFLQGQVTRDFSSPEKLGYRCVTQVPCGEPTGFTGQCTKQPEVGGGWPCLTALPMCSAEPTGFTGQCTHQPWPNPTQYGGCTVYHCPTNDLTHQPHICRMVESAMPNCGQAPQQPQDSGGEEAAGAAANARPVTMMPGCGYTKVWGLCDTQMLGCQPSIHNPCITQTEIPQQCGGGFDLEQVGGPQFTIVQTALCPITINRLECFQPRTIFGPRCPRPHTLFQPQCIHVPTLPRLTPFDPRRVQVPGQFVGAADNVITDPSAVDACPTRFNCETQPPTAFCTHTPQFCPTFCGPECQTPQPQCTSINCTQVGPQCPEPTIGIACTAVPPQCPPRDVNANAAVGAPGGGAHITLLTMPVWACAPTPATRCFICPPRPSRVPWLCPPKTFTPEECPTLGIACTAVPPQCPPRTTLPAQCPTLGKACTALPPQCPPRTISPEQCPSLGIACTSVQCPSAVDACPSRLCGVQEGVGAAGAAGSGQVHITLLTIPQWQCAPTPATACFICTNVPDLCYPQQEAAGAAGQFQTAATVCTQFGHQCQSAVDACPTRLCGTTQFGCGGGGGQTMATTCTQFGHQCQSAVDACPTRLCGQQQFGAAAGIWPTPMTRCFIC